MIPSDPSFHTAVFRALCACLELSPSSAEASALIRPFPNDPEAPPPPPRTHNVIYYDLHPEEAPDTVYAVYSEESPESSSAFPAVSSFLPFRLTVICYGPDCERNAHRIRSFLFLDGSGYPRSILRKAGIYPVPRPPVPVLLDEEEGALLRRRADLTVSLRVKDTLKRESRRIGITEPPIISIRR